MKTPEEIKKGLEWCFTIRESCTGCPYGDMKICGNKLGMDALAYIQQLEQIALHWQSSMDQVQKALQDNGFQTLEELLQAFSQVKAERDAGVRWVFNEEDAKNYKIPENVLTKQQMENLYLVGSDGKRSKMFSKWHSIKGKEGVSDV